MVSVLKEDRQIQRHGKEGLVKIEAEMGKTQLQAKECLIAGSQMAGVERMSSYSAFKGNPKNLSSKV